MYTLVKEQRYVLYAALDTHLLRIEQYIEGQGHWPDKYRLKVPATKGRHAKTFYGPTSRDVARKAAKYLNSVK